MKWWTLLPCEWVLNSICVILQAVGFVSANGHRHGPGGGMPGGPPNGPPPSGMPDAQGGGGAGESSGQGGKEWTKRPEKGKSNTQISEWKLTQSRVFFLGSSNGSGSGGSEGSSSTSQSK